MYYKVVVIKAPLQGLCYTVRDAVDWLFCPTARRFMWNKVTRAKRPVDPASNKHTGGIIMICVGIDVAKDKHDCFILSSEGEVLANVFTIRNNAEGFDTLLQTIRRCTHPEDKIKVGLEATGHYSYNILGFLLDKGLDTYVINPLHTNLYRKSLSLRETKTDRVDARTIAAMLMSDVDLKSYTDTAYHNEELKSLTSEIQSPITTIPGIGFRMGAMILAEIGDFSRFDSPNKILAYAGMSPSTYQSGQLSLSGAYSHMEKRGSRYLRYALYNATKYV